ncbi:hypothetical protein BC831DRAFT_511672 [Entophlyctis helioformis]|nr:hypothetical protein BC831DRAFT_514339 [Entophlyctis helioformis]KAI8926497.1 hypothetical protein BC831DRAFT_511672 [Entophlyctis helioformis]
MSGSCRRSVQLGMKASKLQAFNNEIVKALEVALQQESDELDAKSQELTALINQLQDELHQVRLSQSAVNDKKQRYDKLIKETEHAYAKILESSQTLLDVLHQGTQGDAWKDGGQ